MDKLFGMIGLAMRAGKAVSGEFSVEEALKKRKAFLVIIASDASENTKKKFTDMCAFRKVPLIFGGTKEELGRALGQEIRACAALTDQGFADAVRRIYEEQQIGE